MVFQRYSKTFQVAPTIILYCIVVQILSQFHPAQAISALLMKYTHTSCIFGTSVKNQLKLSIEVRWKNTLLAFPNSAAVTKTLMTYEAKNQKYFLKCYDIRTYQQVRFHQEQLLNIYRLNRPTPNSNLMISIRNSE